MNLTVGLYLKVIKHIYSSSLAGYWLHKGEDQDLYHTVLPQFYRSSLFYYLYAILLALFFPLKFEGYFWATLLLCIHLQEISLHSLIIWPVSLQWNSVGNFFFLEEYLVCQLPLKSCNFRPLFRMLSKWQIIPSL